MTNIYHVGTSSLDGKIVYDTGSIEDAQQKNLHGESQDSGRASRLDSPSVGPSQPAWLLALRAPWPSCRPSQALASPERPCRTRLF